MTYTTDETLASLRNEVEAIDTNENGTRWGVVYLDNARLPGQTDTQFRSHLSALSKAGAYKVIDGN
jgi:hypothetical protein